MSDVEGLESLTRSYLGQDWELFGATPDDVLRNFVKHRSGNLPAAVSGLEGLIASDMTEDELHRHWIDDLDADYTPRDDGLTYREWFAHALDVLRAESARRDG